MRVLLDIVANDVRQRVRDRSVLVFGLVVPLALMTVFSLLFSGLDEGIDLDPVTVAAAVPEGDELGGTLVDVLEGIDLMDVTVDAASAEGAEAAARGGDADLALVVPDSFDADVRAGQPTEVRLVEGEGGEGLEGDVVAAVVDGVVAEMAETVVAVRAGVAEGLEPETLERIADRVGAAEPRVRLREGRAADEQLTIKANLVVGQAGLFMLFTVSFGVLALLREEEMGTMARLRSLPIRRGTIVAAKAAVGLVLGLVATTVLLVAGGLMFGESFGAPAAVAVMVVAAVTAATSLVFLVARVAATNEQAIAAQSVLAIVLGLAGGAFFPVQASESVAPFLDLNPIASFVRGVGITAGGGGVSDLGVPLATLAAFSAVTLGLSRLVPDRAARS